jgi:hypothetical protein
VAGHTVPHAPQFEVSAFVSTQELLQFVVVAGHTTVHAPPEQVSEPAQAVLQAPQWA